MNSIVKRYDEAIDRLQKAIYVLNKIERSFREKVAEGKISSVDEFKKIRSARKKVYEFYKEVQMVRAEDMSNLLQKENPWKLPKTLSDLDDEKFFKEYYGKKILFYSMKPHTREDVLDHLVGISDYSRKSCENALEEAETSGNADYSVVSLFKSCFSHPTKRDYAFVDIETTSINPCYGEIIEIGIILTDSDFNVIEEYEEVFDMEDSYYRDLVGCGSTDIHGLTVEDIKGKRVFSDPEVQKKIGSLLNKENLVMVAHNDKFENYWLETNLDEFYDYHTRLDAEEQIVNRIDTRHLSQYLSHDTLRSRLEDFAESNGIPYENAHRALSDAKMTMEAYKRFSEKIVKETEEGSRPLRDNKFNPEEESLTGK